MKPGKVWAVIVTVAIAAFVSGCDKKPAAGTLPDVNDENCKLENIKRIKDKGMQQEFAGKCARRGGSTRSEPRTW